MTAKSHWREGALVWRLGWARIKKWWWLALVIVQIGAALVLMQGGLDDCVLDAVRQPDNQKLNVLAGKISYWGDEFWSVPLAILLWGAGTIFKRKRWRQLGWTCLFAFLVATVAVDGFRFTLGRARPNSGLPDGFYGPHLASKYQGFPSGHATTSFATAASVLSASPLLRLPCTLYACAVGWARLQVNRHHPLDVLTGAVLGSFVGLCFALPGASFRFRRKPRPLPPDLSD